MTRKKLFVHGPVWAHDTVVGGLEDDLAYAIGYHEAAKVLTERALADRLMDQFFFPICFLYRHAIELSLKALIRQADRLAHLSSRYGSLAPAQLLSEEQLAKLGATHSLDRLFRALADQLDLVGDETLPIRVRAAVVELHNIDPSGQVFRYATLRSGKPSLPHQRHYDLVALRNGLDETLDFLTGGVGSWLNAQIQAAHDALDALAGEAQW